jgi:hypothetical protein
MFKGFVWRVTRMRGEGAKGSVEPGKLGNEHYNESLVIALKAINTDTKTPELQNEFFDRVKGST